MSAKARARTAHVVRAFGRGALLVSLATGCLPAPEPKAKIEVTARGSVGLDGAAAFVTEDGYRLRFDKRLIVLAVATTNTVGAGRYGGGSVRNLDVGPFAMKAIRGIGDQYVGAYTVSYYRSQPAGPGVTEADLDLLDGEPAGQDSRTGVAAFAFQGSLEKDGQTWRFDWRASLLGPSTCGLPGASGELAPLRLESESEHTLEIVIHTDRLFASSDAPTVLRAGAFIAADANRDGIISTLEAATVRRNDLSSLGSWIFELKLDGRVLSCRAPGERDILSALDED